MISDGVAARHVWVEHRQPLVVGLGSGRLCGSDYLTGWTPALMGPPTSARE